MKPAAKGKAEVIRKEKDIEFSFPAPQAQNVFIAGSFNQWNPSSHPLKKDEHGVWKITLPLTPGRYEYRFMTDGKWENDPFCEGCHPNELGTMNCVRIVE
jgi:1,4-alpha-glucan branching enzyme